jgi:hypothetical protein
MPGVSGQKNQSVTLGSLRQCGQPAGQVVETVQEVLPDEPILLDAPDLDPRYRDYRGRVSQMIRENWVYPCVKDEATGKCEYKPVQAVKAASPFPRVPPELMARATPGSARVTIRAVVTYKLVTQP